VQVKHRTFGIALLAAVLTVSATASASTSTMVYSPVLQSGYQQMYDLNFTAAHQTFGDYQRAHPGDPMGYTSDAAAYLFSEFNRLHILESDLFIDDSRFENRSRETPEATLKTAFEDQLAKSDSVAGKILAQNPDDVNALFAQVLSDGLRADYTALIEKRNLASLAYMKSGRILAEKLLTIDPNCYDAYLAVGVENYLLGVNSAPVRWFLRMAGAQTDKAVGLQRLRLTAEKGHYLAPFARLLLAVAALRDKDPGTAKVLLAGLAKQFPNNQLYASELARIQ
jgi:hypothetical protein